MKLLKSESSGTETRNRQRSARSNRKAKVDQLYKVKQVKKAKKTSTYLKKWS